MTSMRNILKEGANALGIKLTDSALEAFSRYYELLEEKNRVMNLTAITGKKDITQLHFLDSLALMTLVDFKGKTLIDIGSGAGFPGIPIKIAEPSLKLTLLDAQKKRVAFMEELCLALHMTDVSCEHGRAEEVALRPDRRDWHDFAASRAVARLNVLCEMCLPFVKKGGAFLAMKSTDSDEEIREAENAVKTLGAAIERISDYEIPGTNVFHRVVIIRKIAQTPDGYPRRYAKIQNSPL